MIQWEGFSESEIRNWPVVLRPLSVKQLPFNFNLFSHLVKSAGLCRSKVEMGKGNDGLEGKLRQHAASQFGGEGKKSDCPGTGGLAEMQTCPTVVIHLIHML